MRRAVDVRVVAATTTISRRGSRRAASARICYYRLDVVPIRVPPLREREDDLPVLVEHFLERFVATAGAKPAASGAAIWAALVNNDWLGNVRELGNLVERLAIVCDREEATAAEVRGLLKPSADRPRSPVRRS